MYCFTAYNTLRFLNDPLFGRKNFVRYLELAYLQLSLQYYLFFNNTFMTKGCVVIWWLLTSLAAIDWVFETSGKKYHKNVRKEGLVT